MKAVLQTVHCTCTGTRSIPFLTVLEYQYSHKESPTLIYFRGITNNVIYLSRFQKHNYDLLYTQFLFPILPHITKVIL